ncbi:molybdopterin-dependent oxidoreductase [Kutzneria chonburiensis]|uniref:Molybdopterin-dependent oxidoreductase n=1 Tax=Kutzneria chonburiensis TaxID=1483604 RepID=A0ABV6MT26_9PSEU|nr:molybdopterin cofactor-binding domain-containing protein [Kutzneria chonburiensis]
MRVNYPDVGQFSDAVTVECVVDDAELSATVPAATALNSFLSGNGHPVNTGCDAGQCGHCLVRLDGELVRSCLVLAAQCDGSKVETVRSADPGLAPVRDWMAASSALQCGHCSPAFVLAMAPGGPLRSCPEDVRSAISDVICRCTGYTGLARAAAGVLSGETPEPKSRVEDARLLNGRGTFVTGQHVPGQLWARIVRSTEPHARIIAIDTTAVEGIVFTGADLPAGMRDFGRDLAGPAEPVLATDTVRYVGEPIALILAESPAAAEDGAAAVTVRYEKLPLLTTPENYTELADDDPCWLPEQSQLVPADWTGPQPEDDVVTLTRRFTLARQTGLPMETRGILAIWEDDTLTLRGITKMPRAHAAAVAKALGLQPEQVRTPTDDVGGAFGVRGELYPEELLAAWAAHELGRPVKWQEDRAEHLVAINHSRGQVWDVTMSATRDGRLLDEDVVIVQDAGAYARPLTALVPYLASAMFPGPYHFRAYRARVRSLLTNRTPIGPVRAPGRFETNFVRERMMDMLAEHLGLSPVEFRSRNLLSAKDMPYDTGTTNEGPVHYDSGDFRAAYEQALSEVDVQPDPGDGLRRGTAVVPYVEKAGLGGRERVTVTVEDDGTVVIESASSPSGQSHETALATVAANELGVHRDQVRVVFPDGDGPAAGLGTFASRTAMHTGNAVLDACRKLKAQGTKRAEGGYDVDAHTYPYGAVTCAVAVDPELLTVRVEHLALSCDVGVPINRDVVHGQLIGGLVQGVSAALYEQLPYDEDGMPLAKGLEHYLVALAADLPDVRITLIDPAPPTAQSPRNPLGVKGIGEAGMAAAAAAVAAAICTAVPELNPRLTATPMTPSRLLEAAHTDQGENR